MLWAEGDRELTPQVGQMMAAALGVEGPTMIAGARHFLQEDKGPEIGALIADWLGSAY